MRLFNLCLSLALILGLSACAVSQPPQPKKYANDAARASAALAGDSHQAYLLGLTACTDEPSAHHGRDTLKWLTLAARSHDEQSSGIAQQALANYYLARFPYYGGPTQEWTYDPRKTRGEVRFCTGSRRSAANDARAEKYLKACAGKRFMAQTVCEENLGKLYLEQKKYAKAYKSFVKIAAWHENGIYDYGKYFPGRLSDLPPNKHDVYFTDMQRIHPQMQEAAKHLSRAETNRIDTQARNDVRASNWRYFRNDARGKVNK